MGNMTLAELEREVARQERRFADTVSKQVYDRDMSEISRAINKIEESQKWSQRLTITVLIGLVIQISLQVVPRL